MLDEFQFGVYDRRGWRQYLFVTSVWCDCTYILRAIFAAIAIASAAAAAAMAQTLIAHCM